MPSTRIREIVAERTISEIIIDYPVVQDFFINYNLQALQNNLTVARALEKIPPAELGEFGLDAYSLTEELVKFMATLVKHRETKEK